MPKVAHIVAVAFRRSRSQRDDAKREHLVGGVGDGAPLLTPRSDEVVGGAGVAGVCEHVATAVNAAVALALRKRSHSSF